MKRILKHLFPPLGLRRVFDAAALSRIESCIAESEQQHSAEIRFAVELGLDVGQLIRGVTAKERALHVFSNLRIWDTERNNGILVYLLLAERDIEIIADRGALAAVGESRLKEVCANMESLLRQGKYVDGVCEGLQMIGAMLAEKYPPGDGKSNELTDAPEVYD